MAKKDYNLLAGFFPAPAKKTRGRYSPRYETKEGRVGHIERGRHSGEWEGWFADDHSVTYIANSKKRVMADMGIARVPKKKSK